MDDIYQKERWLRYLANKAKNNKSLEDLMDDYFNDEITFEEFNKQITKLNYISYNKFSTIKYEF